MRLIVGLGNPGAKYRTTRHNVGFLVVDAFLNSCTCVSWESKYKGLFFKMGESIFLKPLTFMNLSGDSVVGVRNYYGIKNSEIMVIYDDLNLPEGKFRFSFNRSPGGHNGIKSIIACLGGRDFISLRIGIGPREKADSISDYVLENMSPDSMEKLFLVCKSGVFAAISSFMKGSSILDLQNNYNR